MITEILKARRLEQGLVDAVPMDRFQFERPGYFCLDSEDSSGKVPVFNRTVTLRDACRRLRKRGTEIITHGFLNERRMKGE